VHSDYPVRWFVRKGMPCAAFAFVENQPVVLAAKDVLRLRHHLVIADGHWSERDVENHWPALQKNWSELKVDSAGEAGRPSGLR
jgi:hypothetical protein